MKSFGMEKQINSKNNKSILELLGVRSMIRALIKNLINREVKVKKRYAKRK